MKTTLKTALALGAALLYTSFALAADEKKKDDHDHDHDHDHDKIVAGPNGGRVMMSVEPHLELFVTEDRKVRITAVSHDEKPKAIPLGGQSVKLIAGKRLSPTRLEFTKDGNSLISDKTLPEGMNFPVVVQIKATADAKTVLEKFQMNLEGCPTCEYKEYACVCDHAHGHGHDHGDDAKKDDKKKD